MEKLNVGRFGRPTEAEVADAVKEIERTCDEYSFWERTIYPYSFKMTVRELVKNWKDYSRCTPDSKDVILAEMNGFIPILNHWVEYQNEPDVKILYLEGNKKGEIGEVKTSLAEMLIESSLAKAVAV